MYVYERYYHGYEPYFLDEKMLTEKKNSKAILRIIIASRFNNNVLEVSFRY